ncbi:MAG: 4Fe-4S binding protein, partial [Woeseiaceae bacterium]
GRVRSRPAVAWPGTTEPRTDWLVCGDDSLLDPGDGLQADLVLDTERHTVTLYPDETTFGIPVDDEALAFEFLLGGLFGALGRLGRIDATARRAGGTRRDMLESGGDEDRDRLIAAFETGFEGLTEAPAEDTGADNDAWRESVPIAVRELGRNDDHVASLPRFWDQTGVLYRDGRADRLTADPYLATGTMPSLSSTFTDLGRTRTSLPVFDPTLCTGCGHCWTRCPDSAIGVAAVGPAALLDAGIRTTGAEPVRQVASKLATRIIASNKKNGDRASTFGPMLEDAFSWLNEKAPLPEERKQAIEEGVGQIVAEFGNLPVAVTEPFFIDAEARQKDSAELLSIAINPEACKTCGICVASCEPGALVSRPLDDASREAAHRTWETWSATPDTPGTSIDKAAAGDVPGPTAALLLSRYCQFALAGGDHAEAGSGEKLATRLLLAATEYHEQPIVQRMAETLAQTGNEIRALIHETLSGALPEADLDAVADQLAATTSPRIDLKTLSANVTGGDDDHSIDTRYLRRLIDLANRLGEARHALVAGEHGLGRARYGLTIAGGRTAAWAGGFPRNPFQAPVVVDMSGDATQLSAGLVEGHLEATTEVVRLLRLARLEIDRPDGLDWKRDELKALRWHDLDKEELALSPPLILVGSDEMLAARGLSQLMWLLNSRLPVKVLILSSLDLGLDEVAVNDPRGGIGMLALAQRNAFIAQTSVADAGHFGTSVLQALEFDGPALIQVYAPSPSRDGFASKQAIEQARRAVRARVLPLFRYDPRAAGVFGSRISLDGNSDRAALLDSAGGVADTPAHWALGQARFASHFEPLAASASGPVPLDEWLAMDAAGRRGKTPYVASGEGDEEQRYGLSAGMLHATRECLDRWRTLQELAGIVTPFTAKLESEIRAEVAAQHQAELEEQKKSAAAEIEEIRQKTQAEIAKQLRSRLLELATRQRG